MIQSKISSLALFDKKIKGTGDIMFNPIKFLAIAQTVITLAILFLPPEKIRSSFIIRLFAKITDWGTPIVVGVLSVKNEYGSVPIHLVFWIPIVYGWICPHLKDVFPKLFGILAFFIALAYPWGILFFIK